MQGARIRAVGQTIFNTRSLQTSRKTVSYILTVPDRPDRNAVFPHQIPHCAAISLHDLLCRVRKARKIPRNSRNKSVQQLTTELVQGSRSSQALIHDFQVAPPTSSPPNSESSQLSHPKSRVTSFLMIYKTCCLHYLQARTDY